MLPPPRCARAFVLVPPRSLLPVVTEEPKGDTHYRFVYAISFEYKTNLVWVKPSIGLGSWARNRHELLLLGRKGSFPLADPEDRPDSVIEAARGRHSEKPECVYQLLERMYPQASKLELFARGKARAGWVAWGNEATR